MNIQATQRSLVVYICLLYFISVPSTSCKGEQQTPHYQADQVTTSVDRAKDGKFTSEDIQVIAKAGSAREALPSLEKQFVDTDEPEKQGVIAAALVKLGDSDGKYWDFLVQQAMSAVQSDMPDPYHDAQGRSTGQKPSTEFVTWARSRHISLNSAIETWAYGLPGSVLRLSMTHDQRSIPILRRALESQNPGIVMMASEGLAQLRDTESIPAIIAACKRFDKDAASAIAEDSLIYFHDSQAQSAVDLFVPEGRAKARREAITQRENMQ